MYWTRACLRGLGQLRLKRGSSLRFYIPNMFYNEDSFDDVLEEAGNEVRGSIHP